MLEETGETPVAEAIAATPNPIVEAQPEPQQPEPAKPEAKVKEPVSISDSLKAAQEKIEGRDKAAPKVEAKPEAKVEVKTDTKPADATKPVNDAPSRFSPEAKADWANAPETVKAEVRRATTELESGLKEYQAKFEALKPFEEIAKKSGTTIPAALDNYLKLEMALQENPTEGLKKVFEYIGIDPRQYAAHILGQSPDVQANEQNNTIRELKQEIAQLGQQLAQVASGFEGQQQAEKMSQIEAFAAANPRFDELHESIAEMLQLQELRGETKDLAKAYEMAERLNPAPFTPAPSTPSAQTASRVNKSITGAPGVGSTPAARLPSTSIEESLKRALARVT